jgi:hypothetical protein
MKSKILFTLFGMLLYNLSNAQCTSYVDNFETGNLSLWTTIGSTITTSTSNVLPAEGVYGCKIVGGSGQHLKGISRSFSAISPNPNTMSWYMKPVGAGQSNCLVAGDNTVTAVKSMVFCYWLGSTNEIVFTGTTAGASYNTAATANVWHLIELKTINFTTHTFDIWVDGVLKQANFAFRSNLVNSIEKVHLYNYDSLATGNWDNIKFGSSSTIISKASALNATSTTGITTDTDNQGAGQTIIYTSNTCNLISTVVSSANLGSTSAKVTVESVTPTHNTQPYVKRWFEVTPTTQGSGNITFYFTQNDFNTYNTTANATGWPLLPQNSTDAVGKANLRITKNDGALGVNPVVLTPSSIIWNSLNSYWEVSLTTPSFSQFRFHAVNPLGSALPVYLGNFSGKKEYTTNVLNWNTITENNCKAFEVQRSLNGTDFTALGMVNSQAVNGTSNLELNYSFVDVNPKQGHNYYRLRQIDLDGKSTYSKEIDLVGTSNGSVINVYPNPAKDNVTVEYANNSNATLSLQLIDMSGRIIKQIETKVTSGNNEIFISLDGVTVGMYQLQLIENNRLSFVQKIVKQ